MFPHGDRISLRPVRSERRKVVEKGFSPLKLGFLENVTLTPGSLKKDLGVPPDLFQIVPPSSKFPQIPLQTDQFPDLLFPGPHQHLKTPFVIVSS